MTDIHEEATVTSITGMIDVIGIDPGGTTGLAHYLASDMYPDKAWFTSFEGKTQITLDYLEMYLAQHKPYVVFERFTPRRGPYTNQRAAPDAIGAILEICGRTNTLCAAQGVSEAKTFFDNSVLRQFGFLLPRSQGHANDAARHVALCIHRLWPYEMAKLRKGDKIAKRIY